ncbi:MAG TPA: AI-2E family transporter [Mycobacteriales bacterium]|jgi:predicted PurR-regulated permease PerM|nr:AI-2E family transporter [Mycobacteriales bacterium]
MPVPAVLQDLAGWGWRIVVLGFIVLEFFRFANKLYFVALPLFAALFATALAYPIVNRLARRMPRAIATWLVVIVAAIVAIGVGIFVINRAVSQYSDLVTQIQNAVTKFQHFLTHNLHVKASSTTSIQKTITDFLQKHQTAVASGALNGITTVGETIAGFVLWFFMTFFLLYDGHNIWNWFVALLPPRGRARAQVAGEQAWNRLSGFVHGTFIIALVHGVVAAVALSAMGVPLVAPLALLIFFGSFLPIVGSIVFGALAVAITFVTQGWVLGVVLIAVLVVDNQIEAHVLQPFLVGRYVQLHPLAVATAIAAGTVLEGIAGAVLAVPVVAVVYAVIHSLATGGAPPPESHGEGIESLGGDPPDPEKADPPVKRAPAKRAPAKRAPAKKAAPVKKAAARSTAR